MSYIPLEAVFMTNDPRALFVRALDQTQQLVNTTGPDDLDLQTPCDEYDVRTLLGHLLTVHVPLGVLTIVAAAALAVWAWRYRWAG